MFKKSSKETQLDAFSSITNMLESSAFKQYSDKGHWHRVFNEQYKISEDQQIELRPKEEISSSSVQSPHDTDSAYRNKQGQQVKDTV